MNLEELKRRREENILKHKQKKKAYYLKKKLQDQKKETTDTKSLINFDKELFSGSIDDFNLKIKDIVKKQKAHITNREDVIMQRVKE